MIVLLGTGEKEIELPRGIEADQFAWLQFKPEMLAQQNIPTTAYPIRKCNFDQLIASGGVISIVDIVHGLMDWLDITNNPNPVCQTLRQILDQHFPPSLETSAGCNFQTDKLVQYRFRIGPVDAASPVVTWERQQWVVAIGCASDIEPGRLNIAALGPISLQTARSIFNHCQLLENGEPKDSFLAARLSSAKLRNLSKRDAGGVTIVAWDYGYGNHGHANFEARETYPLSTEGHWLTPNQTASMIAIGNGFL